MTQYHHHHHHRIRQSTQLTPMYQKIREIWQAARTNRSPTKLAVRDIYTRTNVNITEYNYYTEVTAY